MVFPAVLFSVSVGTMGKIYRVCRNTTSEMSVPVIRKCLRIVKGENWWELRLVLGFFKIFPPLTEAFNRVGSAEVVPADSKGEHFRKN